MAGAATMEGPVLFGLYTQTDTFNWTDPTNGQVKPIVSYKVLVSHGDGTRTMESIALPPNYRGPDLKPGSAYGFAVIARVNRKQLKISWTMRTDIPPFDSPPMQ